MLRYCSPFLILAGIPLLYHFAGPLWPIADISVFLIALIAAEHWSSRQVKPRRPILGQYRLLPLFYIPAQLGVVAWAAYTASTASTSGLVALAFSVGVTAGVFGMLCAHELAHSRRRFDRLVALAMLTGTSNRQFRIAHIFGHHRRAATEQDAATARLGENFYAFLARTLPGQWKEAWEFERRRCRGLTFLRNRACQDVVVTVLVYAAVVKAFGIPGFFFFLIENSVAIVVLELFNYIAHYGLIRAEGCGALYPDICSWNSSSELANLLIFNMGRHSDHHRRPTASYQSLSGLSGAPELPFGYAGSILLALIPPLWRHVMDPRVMRMRHASTII